MLTLKLLCQSKTRGRESTEVKGVVEWERKAKDKEMVDITNELKGIVGHGSTHTQSAVYREREAGRLPLHWRS